MWKPSYSAGRHIFLDLFLFFYVGASLFLWLSRVSVHLVLGFRASRAFSSLTASGFILLLLLLLLPLVFGVSVVVVFFCLFSLGRFWSAGRRDSRRPNREKENGEAREAAVNARSGAAAAAAAAADVVADEGVRLPSPHRNGPIHYGPTTAAAAAAATGPDSGQSAFPSRPILFTEFFFVAFVVHRHLFLLPNSSVLQSMKPLVSIWR